MPGDHYKPSKDKPRTIVPDVPETDAPVFDLPEGQLPGMPLSHDPAFPSPTPSERERKPLD